MRILQWLLVARRPLRKPELESGIYLGKRRPQILTSDKPRGDVLSVCQPLIDVEYDASGRVSFVHFTVIESVPLAG